MKLVAEAAGAAITVQGPGVVPARRRSRVQPVAPAAADQLTRVLGRPAVQLATGVATTEELVQAPSPTAPLVLPVPENPRRTRGAGSTQTVIVPPAVSAPSVTVYAIVALPVQPSAAGV